MTEGPRKKRSLGRGMGDLVGDTLESLVRGVPAREPPRPEAGRSPAADSPPEAGEDPAPGGSPGRAWARVFAVASGKGGTGKSVLAVNLAAAMAADMKVCLIDADMGLANAHILMGLLPRYDVSHLIAGVRRLEEVVLRGPRGTLLLPGASGVPEMACLDDSSLERFAAAAAPLLERCDAAILDCPSGLSRQSLLLLHGADVVIVVTTDDLTAMTDAYALIKTLTIHRPQAAVGLVVNGSRSASEGADTFRKIAHVARKFLGRDLLSLGTIPRDPLLERSVPERQPVVLGHPSSPAARAIEEIARRIVALEGLEAAIGFPDRLRRTLTASAVATAAGSGNGGHRCA